MVDEGRSCLGVRFAGADQVEASPYTGWGQDARLRTQFQRRKEVRSADWNDDWDSNFSDFPTDPDEIRRVYRCLMEAFAVDIGVHDSYMVPHSGAVPANIR